jgi:hypothetical protein
VKPVKTVKGLLKEPVKTIAENSGISSVTERAKEIHLIIQSALPPAPAPEVKKRTRKPLSEDQKNVLRERLAKARDAKRALKGQ